MANFHWTEETVGLLKQRWDEGCSCGEIASEIGTVSRCAVAGKIGRLKLPKRETKCVAKTGPTRKGSLNFTRMQKPKPWAVFVSETPEPVKYLGAAEPHRTIQTLAEHECKWPLGDPGQPGFHFCGQSSEIGVPYCNYHMRIAYQPLVRTRQDEAA